MIPQLRFATVHYRHMTGLAMTSRDVTFHTRLWLAKVRAGHRTRLHAHLVCVCVRACVYESLAFVAVFASTCIDDWKSPSPVSIIVCFPHNRSLRKEGMPSGAEVIENPKILWPLTAPEPLSFLAVLSCLAIQRASTRPVCL